MEADRLPFDDDQFSAVLCVGVLSYLTVYDHLFEEWCRVGRPGAVVCFTQRRSLWNPSEAAARQTADRLVAEGTWERLEVSKPSNYMPANPDEAERKKKILYVVHRVL